MAKLKWRKGMTMYHPLEDAVYVGEREVEKGWAPAALAHELAHRREGILTHIVTEPSERTFWKELAVWQSAMEKGLSSDELSEELIEDSLGSHLEAMKYDYGEDSYQYRYAKEAYDSFKRRYL